MLKRNDLCCRSFLNASTCFTALGLAIAALGATSAHAQDAAPQDASAEPAADGAADDSSDIIVTGSRVVGGFAAPTPTTVIGSEQVELRAATNVASLLNELPAFKATLTPASAGLQSQNAGSNFLDLRSLGAQRTLILVNGRRHVATTSAGLVDINAIPVTMVKRVEVVTGGASAAYGSDAVAGVVNLILDDKFSGVKLEGQSGISTYGDGAEYRFGGMAGTGFADDRGHIVIGGEYSNSKGIPDQMDRPWGRGEYQLITNPDYTPTNGQFQRIIAPNVHLAIATEGGLINSGVLAGTQFLPGGATAPFQYGQYRSGAFMQGGDGISMNRYSSLAVPVERYNMLAHASYALTDTINIYGEASFARSKTSNDVVQPFDFASLTIEADNAFLPAAVQDAMATAGETSFNFGRIDTDFGFYRARIDNKTKRGVIGLNGSLGKWEWDAYYQEGETNYTATLRNRVESRYANSVDSVLVNNQPTCRINADADTTNDDPACVPVNLFGFGAPSAAALNYFMATQIKKTKINQRVAEVSLRGSPFATWAGDVKLAIGADYRREAVTSTVDALSAADAFQVGNPKAIRGSYNVKEAFGEVLLPLLADAPLAKSFDVNAAVRYTDYSISGTVTTWKVGATWAINDAIRLRATRSRDIRAPNIDELFTTGTLQFDTITDPNDNVQYNIRTLTGGSTALKPEKADTLTAGIVLQPSFMPGFRASVDYYDIKIDGAIGTLSAQDIVDRCDGGNAALCDRITRNGSGNITEVTQTSLNLSKLKTRGVDTEISYTRPMRIFDAESGTIGLRLLGTYVDKLETDDGVTAVDRAGDLGNGLGGVPHWRLNGSITYQDDSLTLYAQGRYIGSGKYDHTYTGTAINNNRIPSVFYLDLSAQFNVINEGNRTMQVFAKVDNVFNKAPPINPSSFFATINTAPEFYDVMGRYFTFGVRTKF